MLTGFLGSGKTTLLSRFLETASGARTAVLINEMGAVALDHLLLEKLDRDVALLPPGCVCCVVTDDLDAAVERALGHDPDHIVLETTGLADPAPVLHALATSRTLAGRLSFGGVIVTLDASRGAEVIDAEPEGRFQLDLADRAVLTKLDVASPEPVEGLRERLATDHPHLEVIDATDAARAFAPPSHPAHHLRSWLDGRKRALAHGAATRVIELPPMVHVEPLMLWLRMVTMLDGPQLLRIKGLVETEHGCVLLQSAQRAVSPPRTLAQRPDAWTGSRLVVISRGLSERSLDALEGAAQDAARSAP